MPKNRNIASLIAGWKNMSPTFRGIILISISTVGFTTMHMMVRLLSGELHPFQIAFFRNFFGLIVFLPVLLRHGLDPFKTKRLPLQIFRSILNIVAMLTFFYALSISPLARVTALGFSAPIFAAVLSFVILGERFRLHRWSAILLGFVGALIILRPGIIPLDLGSFLVLASTFVWGFTLIVIKVLARTDSSMTITCYMSVLLTIFSLGPAIWFWRAPQFETWFWLVAIGISGTLAQLLMVQALKEGETTVVLPFDFLKLIWATIFGYWLFAETVDLWTWVGAAVIITSGIYVAYRERVVKQLEKPE